MKTSDLFPKSKFFKAADIPAGKEVEVAISEVRMEQMATSGEEKPVLYFEGKKQGLVLNATNTNRIAAAYGGETDLWSGKPLVLYGTVTDYRGEEMPCLRVRVPQQAPTQEQVNAELAEAVEGDSVAF